MADSGTAAGGSSPAIPRLIPVKDWPKFHPWPTVAGLRWLVFHAKTKGLDAAVVRVGHRVLIDEAKFFEWVRQQNAPR
jgi:hypothetical protein